MPGPKALKIELTDAEREHLEKTVRKQTAPQRQVRRSKIVLMAAALGVLVTVDGAKIQLTDHIADKISQGDRLRE